MRAQPVREALTNVEVVTYALSELGGVDRAVHLEDVAVKAYSFSPGAFRWDREQYSDFIDKDKVRVSLTDAEKREYGSLVRAVGVTKRGKSKRTDLWRLTAEGAVWVVEHEERIRTALGGPTSRLKRTTAAELRRRLSSSPLYEEYQRHGHLEPNPYAFTDLLECSPDASDAVVQQRFDELAAKTRLLDDDELAEFLRACADAHADMFDLEVSER